MALAAIKTQRLVLREFLAEDARSLFALMSDAVSMRHTYVAPCFEHCLARLSAYEAMRQTFQRAGVERGTRLAAAEALYLAARLIRRE